MMLATRRQFLGGLSCGGLALASGTALAASTALETVQAYRNPGCGCCEKWADAMAAAGFKVSMSDDADLATRREKLGVPADLAGCHLAFAGGYVIEGHVPPKEIVRLLAERPDAQGLAVPGMPAGSPGMESGEGTAETYDVVLFTAKGERKLFASY